VFARLTIAAVKHVNCHAVHDNPTLYLRLREDRPDTGASSFNSWIPGQGMTRMIVMQNFQINTISEGGCHHVAVL
jgi:hypothetical protein